jgi:hypothetical protein
MENVNLAMVEALVCRGRRLVHHVTLEALADQGRGRVPNVMQAHPLVKAQLNALLVHPALSLDLYVYSFHFLMYRSSLGHREHQSVRHVRRARLLATDSVHLAMLEALVHRGRRLVHHVMLDTTVDRGPGRVPNVMQALPLVKVQLNALLVRPVLSLDLWVPPFLSLIYWS